jgi:RNA polymerase sigma-70 factor (ECF subfamily)
MGSLQAPDAEHSDEELMARVVKGSEAALLQLYQRHVRAVYSLAVYIVRDERTGEDITQEVFTTLWQKADLFEPARGRFTTWLLNITRHRAIDVLRQQSRRIQPAVSLDADPLLQENIAGGPRPDDARGELHLLLALLPDAQRQVIELSYFQGYTHEEIAGRLNLPAGTVKSRILLGLRKLRDLMKSPKTIDDRRTGT